MLKKNRLTTRNKLLAQKFKIPKEVPIHAIKNKHLKKHLLINGAWRKIYTYDKKEKLYYLPPVSFPWAIEKWYIDKNWRNQTYNKIKSRFDSSVMYWYQKESVSKMSEYLDAWGKAFFIRSWTATWKSFMIYGIIDSLRSKTLIVAPKKIINSQLFDDLEKYFDNVKTTGKAIGKNLDGLLKADILIITHQALNLYYDKINDAWFDTMLLDEWHYVPESRTEQFNKWKGRNIIWLSANRQRKDVSEENFPKLYWWFYDTWEEAVDMRVVTYKYKYEYSIDDFINAGKWYAVDSPEINRKLVINNKDRLEALLEILDNVKSKYNKIIIFTDRTSQIDILSEQLPWAFVMKWGLDNVATKNKLLWLDNYVLLAMEQVVREWMNIPWLEFWILFFSSSEINTIQQLAGRVRRFAPGKEFWYLLDFIDILSIEWYWKKKIMWYYNRKKIYKALDFKEIPYEEFFNKLIV